MDNYCCAQEASQELLSSNQVQQDLKRLVKLLLCVQIIAVGDGESGMAAAPTDFRVNGQCFGKRDFLEIPIST